MIEQAPLPVFEELSSAELRSRLGYPQSRAWRWTLRAERAGLIHRQVRLGGLGGTQSRIALHAPWEAVLASFPTRPRKMSAPCAVCGVPSPRGRKTCGKDNCVGGRSRGPRDPRLRELLGLRPLTGGA